MKKILILALMLVLARCDTKIDENSTEEDWSSEESYEYDKYDNDGDNDVETIISAGPPKDNPPEDIKTSGSVVDNHWESDESDESDEYDNVGDNDVATIISAGPPKDNPPEDINTGGSIVDSHWDSLTSPYAPPEDHETHEGPPHIVTEARLKRLQEEFMYWFWDQGGNVDNTGDHQANIHSSSPTLHKNLNFELPFFGFKFNYTRVSLNGYLEFSDPPEKYPSYPLVFPNKDWPQDNDLSFIGIFFSRCRIGALRHSDIDKRKPGVYFRLERDLQTRKDVFGSEVRERLTWDIRTGAIGADSFKPTQAIIVTWKNISFTGGIPQAMYTTNTFQLVLATDEVTTYAIFNYKDLNWTTHTEARGDTLKGEGGVPAYVGFNAGNGTRSYEYKPYSQSPIIRDLSVRGLANNFPGRHIFRIDENIMLGTL